MVWAPVCCEGDVVEPRDYLLTRPPAWTPDQGRDFADLYAFLTSRRGPVEIGDELSAPPWMFLCWVAEHRGVLLHGAGRGRIPELRPQRPADTSEFGGQEAVFATSDGIWALFFAIVDRRVATSLVNGSFVIDSPRHERRAVYYFSVNRDALAKNPWRPGTVYLLPSEGFVRQSDLYVDGSRIRMNQWARSHAVRPFASLAVQPQDFPFLTDVQAHDPAVVSERAARDPLGFPWRS